MQKYHHSPFFQQLEQLPKYRSLLCLHGDLPDSAFFQKLPLPVIAADGAANVLAERGVDPHLIIGDLDSVQPEILSRIPHKKIEDQNTSDLQKALAYLEQSNLLPTIVLGVNGGFLDHILCNISLLSQSRNLFYDPPHLIAFFLDQGVHLFNSWPLLTKLSLIGAPSCIASSIGLKWELENSKLEFWKDNSFFNRSASREVKLDIREGRLLLLLYLNPIDDRGSSD